jgi:2-dehydropantoate 2-reductase
MNIAIVGLGAMGGLIAAKLIQAGYQVKALARGQTLSAVLMGRLSKRDSK